MTMQVSAQTYTSAAEMIEAAKLRRAKLFNGAKVSKAKEQLPIDAFYKGISIYPPDLKPVTPRKNKIATPHPAKAEEQKTYDLHVRDWRAFTMRFSHNRYRFHIFIRCRDFGVSVDEIYSDSRFREIIEVKHVIIWELKTLFHLTHTQIGKLFGRDHTTMLYAIRKVQDMIDRGEMENPLAGFSVANRG